MKTKFISCALTGIAILLFFKYIVFGLEKWNSLLHPERIEGSNSMFRKPLLGLLK